jgi:cell division protein FtsI/penicillin-binding protein 2
MIPPRMLATTPPRQTQAFEISDAMLAPIREGMLRCVTSGTAKANLGDFEARRGISVAGKTGTAERVRPVFDEEGRPVEDPGRPILNADGSPRLKPDGTPSYKQVVDTGTDAWFVGYAPADRPQFVVAAVMEWGGHGGAVAAPMAREAFIQLQRHGYLGGMRAVGMAGGAGERGVGR